jgi:hypothetical protein
MTSGSEGDRLYALPLEEFTKARDELAARLRKAGDKDEAAGVKALKKPSTPAWAVNQLSRRSRDTIDELIEAADRLRKAQQELLHGGPAQAVWEATLAEREALGRLTEDAEKILTDAGHAAARGTLDKVSDTLAAAAADPTGRALLRRGILTSEMQRSGFGDLLGGEPEARALKSVPTLKPERVASARARRSAGKDGPTAKAILEAERDAARASKEAVRAGEEAEKTERDSERADAAAALARKRAGAAEAEANQARAKAATAAKTAQSAIREAERAQARLEKLRTKRR